MLHWVGVVGFIREEEEGDEGRGCCGWAEVLVSRAMKVTRRARSISRL